MLADKSATNCLPKAIFGLHHTARQFISSTSVAGCQIIVTFRKTKGWSISPRSGDHKTIVS
jgi:hypothetical protein